MEEVAIDFDKRTVKYQKLATVRVEIDLTMNTDGEWCAFGADNPTQNHWRNSMKYKLVADVPKPTVQQVSAVCHPVEVVAALRNIAGMHVPASDCDPVAIQRAVYEARTLAREALGIEDS